MEDQKNSNGGSDKRKIDTLAEETYSWWKDKYLMVKRTKIRTWKAIFIVAFFAGAASATVWGVAINIQNSSMAAEEATLYLDPLSSSFDIGEDFDLDVLLDPKNNNIVAVKAIIKYNPIHFALSSWTTENSAFSSGNTCQYQGKDCEIVNNDPNKGEITITVAKPAPGINSAFATIASLKFKALAPVNPSADNITISYLGKGRYDDSDVIVDDGNGTDLLNHTIGAQIKVNNPVCASFTYNDWGTCQENGKQTRTVSSSSPDGCTGGNPLLEQSCTFVPPTCSTFTYSDWGTCQPNGKQTRTVSSSSPAWCTGGNLVLEQTCTVSPGPTCSTFTYSDWGTCQENGKQTRTVSSSSPDGCTGGNPLLEQSCTFVPPTCSTFTYSDWGTCQPNGKQTRTVSSSSPAGCTGGNPVLEQDCTISPTECSSFNYSDWSSCQPNGKQSRTVSSALPGGCSGGNPVLEQNCTVTPGTTTCSIFTYSDWSSCQPNNTKSRTVVSSIPYGCSGGSPKLTESCSYSANTTPSDKDEDKDKDKEKNPSKPKFANFPFFHNKIRGAKMWWTVKNPSRVNYYNVTFNGKKTKSKSASFIIPPGTSRGIHTLRVQIVNKSGMTASRSVIVRVR